MVNEISRSVCDRGQGRGEPKLDCWRVTRREVRDWILHWESEKVGKKV